jgi:hypothetical protein
MPHARFAAPLLAIMAAAVLSACALGAAGPAPSPTLAPQGAWSFDFDAGPGVAKAVFTGTDGRTLFQISCQSPRGPMVFADRINAQQLGGQSGTARLSIGPSSADAPASSLARDGQDPVIQFSLAPAAEVFQTITPAGPVTIQYGGMPPLPLPAGAATQINTVLNACITRGS